MGVAGATLGYTDGTARTVTSQSNGSYSFTVPETWSGTVTPSHACFTFNPLHRDYANVTGDQTLQDYAATLASGSGCADVDISVGVTRQGRFGLPSQGSARASFTGINNGPVKIESTNAVPISYLANGSSNLHPDDIILRSAEAPTASKPVITDVLTSPATKSVADRLKEIEDLYNRKLLTDPEYQEKRAKVIAEL